jgi:uncharacterized protein GlcG (DUF336 family)
MKRVPVNERLLERMQSPVVGQALDGDDPPPVVHHRKRQAGVDTATVNQQGACTARAPAATLLRFGQSRLFAQHIQQRHAVVGEFSMLTGYLGAYDGGVAFVVAVVGAVTSGNGGPGGDGATHGD